MIIGKRKRTIAERQKKLDHLIRNLEYIIPIAVSSVATAVCIMALR